MKEPNTYRQGWTFLQEQLLDTCRARSEEGLFCSAAGNAIKLFSGATAKCVVVRSSTPDIASFAVYLIPNDGNSEQLVMSLDFDSATGTFLHEGWSLSAEGAAELVLTAVS